MSGKVGRRDDRINKFTSDVVLGWQNYEIQQNLDTKFPNEYEEILS